MRVTFLAGPDSCPWWDQGGHRRHEETEMESNRHVKSRVWKAWNMAPGLHSPQTEHFRNRFSQWTWMCWLVKTTSDSPSQIHRGGSKMGVGRRHHSLRRRGEGWIWGIHRLCSKDATGHSAKNLETLKRQALGIFACKYRPPYHNCKIKLCECLCNYILWVLTAFCEDVLMTNILILQYNF